MSIVTELSLATVLLTLAMDTAQANYAVTQIDCSNVNYRELATQYEGKIKAATQQGNQALITQAQNDRKGALENAQACDAFARAHSTTSASPSTSATQ